MLILVWLLACLCSLACVRLCLFDCLCVACIARFFYIQPVMMVKQATTAYFDAVDPTHATQVASKL